MSVILRQLEEMKAALTASAQWEDLVSVEEIAEKTHKSIQSVKELLAEKGLQHKAKLGKCYLYSKIELLQAIKIDKWSGTEYYLIISNLSIVI